MGALQSDVIVAVLDTMWVGREARAPRYFKINSHNHTGKRLYKFVGPENAHRLLVTNVCREAVSHANRHGKPDPDWLLENLKRLDPYIILVCGKVAQKAFKECGYMPLRKPIYIQHPAARTWTKKQLRETERRIQKVLQ